MSCCSESTTRLLLAICHAPSVEPVVENDQHEPHWPWFLTGVTAPLVRQSTLSCGALMKKRREKEKRREGARQHKYG